MWTVLKYGGSSLTVQGFQNIVKRVEERQEGERIVIVLSAIKGITDLLIELPNSKKSKNIIDIHNNFIESWLTV